MLKAKSKLSQQPSFRGMDEGFEIFNEEATQVQSNLNLYIYIYILSDLSLLGYAVILTSHGTYNPIQH
jgi:hypothetical protein